MLAREGHIGQHVVFAVVHQRRELGPAWSQLIGDMPPGLMRRRSIGLQEGLADRGGDHGVLAFLHVRQGIAHPVHDPNAIDRLHFTIAVAFCWAALAKPRRRRNRPSA
jgi:hypothetical protein